MSKPHKGNKKAETKTPPIPIAKLTTPAVFDQAFKKAVEEKNSEMLNRLLDFAKEQKLTLPWGQVMGVVLEAAMRGDVVTIKLLFAHTPVDKISDLACPAIRLHNLESHDSQHGMWRRKLDPAILDLLKENINVASSKWLKLIDTLLEDLADANRYPENIKGYISTSAHIHLRSKIKLISELTKIKQLVQTAYPSHYQAIGAELTKALDNFQKGITDKKGVGERYLKSFFELLGEGGRALHVDAYLSPQDLKEKVQSFVYQPKEEKVETRRQLD